MKKVNAPEIKKALETLGLTQYETKTYISLVEKNKSDAKTLSKLTQIPRSKIYEVLTRLEKKKLIEIEKNRPTLFKSIKPSIAVEKIETQLKEYLTKEYKAQKSIIETNFNKKMQEITAAKNIILNQLDKIYEKTEDIEPSEVFVLIIRGKNSLKNYAQELILKATQNIQLMIPTDDFCNLESVIKTAVSKGVKAKLFVHNLTDSVKRLKDSAEIFIEDSPFPTNCGIILVDDETGMFISDNCTVGFKTSSKSALTVLSKFYEHELEESVKVKL